MIKRTIPRIMVIFLVLTTSYIRSFSISDWFTRAHVETLPAKEYKVSANSTLEIRNIKGSINVKSWDHESKIALDVVKKGTEQALHDTTIGIVHKESNLIITTYSSSPHIATIDYTLMVPQNAQLSTVSTEKGDIKIKQVRSSMRVTASEGNIEISDSVQSVIAKTNKGYIRVRQRTLTEPSSLFLETLQGNVYLSLPRNTNALLQARTQNGTITSEQPITLNTITTKLNKEFWNSIKSDIKGILGDGGAPITIDVTKGTIALTQY